MHSKCALRSFVRRGSDLFRLAFRAQVDPELLALFVEVAAFQAQGAGGVGHVVMVAAQFGEQHFALERFHALRQAVRFPWPRRVRRCARPARPDSLPPPVMVSPPESSRTRSTTLRNSRTLPGHA